MNDELAWYILNMDGNNYALSDVEEACKFLDHPELKEDDERNYHLWALPFQRRCYCGAIGYTENGRYYANVLPPERVALVQKFFPKYRNRFGEEYKGKP